MAYDYHKKNFFLNEMFPSQFDTLPHIIIWTIVCLVDVAAVFAVAHLLGIPPHLIWSSFYMTHTGVTVVNFEKNPSGLVTPRCLCWSDMSHLLDSGLPYSYNNTLPV